MTALQSLEYAAGSALILIIFFDVFNAVIVPRPTDRGPRVSSYIVRYTWRFWRAIGLNMRSARKRESWFGAFAPLAVIELLIAWGLGLIAGYGFELHALRHQIQPIPGSLASSIYFAGVSMLTLGFGDMVATGALARFTVLAAAASGLGLFAVVISFIFSLFASFQRREILVVNLDARAGAPPSGIALLETHARLGLVHDLDRVFLDGQRWAAEVLDSHLAYPILAYFRSSHVDISWFAALGALLDAAALVATTVVHVADGQARLMHEIGTHLTDDLASYFRLPHEEQVLVERQEFEQARQRLADAGFALRDAEDAWTRFSQLRRQYASALNVMARHWAIQPAQWIGDRSTVTSRVHA